ncbi:MAG: NADH:flavin oxidoreductase/NADH oxidase [Firmicutes bacterium]|nr:NADH:flavin oxidoreductase/NADH oxidase [Bacillota bacterium]
MSKLYRPGNIGQLVIRNRLVMTPMHLAYCPEGEVSDRIIEFYRLRAKGGVGLIIVGAVGIDPKRVNTHGMLQIYDDKFIPGLSRLAASIQAEGAKVFPQLMHVGRYARSQEHGGAVAVAPSAVPSRFTGETPRELGQQEIEEIIGYFAAAARRANQAGFDGLELAGSAGYLIAQFLSPVTNLRKDRYGGSLAGRMTFALEVVAAVRQAVGSDFPLMMRIAGNDFIPGGHTGREAGEFAKALEAAGIDAVNVTGGWHETGVPQLTMDVPPGAFSYLGRAVKEKISIPVVVCNRMDPLVAEKIVDEGNADFIGIARGFVADPELADKARLGAHDTIRPCVACNQGCMDNIFFGKQLSCLVNCEAGREAELKEEKAKRPSLSKPERILVIGAGVAGLEYARIAAERGHRITIWEKDSEVGGQARLAAAPPGRRDFLKFAVYLNHACLQGGVSFSFNREATAEAVMSAVRQENYDRVVIATGARPAIPPFDVEDGTVVLEAWQVLKDPLTVGDSIVIVGGGAVGVETALKLSEIGTIDADTLRFLVLHQAESPEELYRLLTTGNKKITLVEMGKAMGKDIGPSTRWSMLAQLKKFRVTTLTQTRVVAAKTDCIVLERDSVIQEIPADTVILAAGACANDELYVALKGKLERIDVIGDAYKPRKLQDAVREAHTLACELSYVIER